MSKRQPCETCPFMNFPLADTEVWGEIAEAQRRATPEYSDATNDHMTAVEKQKRAGMEAHMDECPGYSLWKALGNRMLFGVGQIVDTGRGTRLVRWDEKTCNNPFLKTDEYEQLASEMTHQSARAYEESLATEGV